MDRRAGEWTHRQWPELRLADWAETLETLHRSAQVVGKVKLALAPPLNHFWQVAFFVTPRGLTTGNVPWREGSFEIQFDFVDHTLLIDTSEAQVRTIALKPRTVAAFHRELVSLLGELGIEAHIWRMPVEIADPIPLDVDEVHRQYDPAQAHRFHRALLQADGILRSFMSGFQGKQSPVQFFWGGFDLCQARFSGRRAPPRPEADAMTREAMSHEEMSFGFWPGAPGVADTSFYAYCAPEPEGLSTKAFAGASYQPQLREFLLPYEAVRGLPEPRDAVLHFFESFYEAAAELAGWNRAELDRVPAAVQPRLLWPGQPAVPADQ